MLKVLIEFPLAHIRSNKGATSTTVDTFTVFLKPMTNLPELFNLPWLNPPVRHGIRVQCQVTIPNSTGDEHLDSIGVRLEFVVRFPCPLRSKGDTALPGAIELTRSDLLLGSIEVAGGAGTIVYQYIRLDNRTSLMTRSPRALSKH